MFRAASRWRAVFPVECEFSAGAFFKVSPVLCDAFEIKGVTSAVSFLAEVFVKFNCSVSHKVHVEHVEIAIAMRISNGRKVIELDLNIDLSGETFCQQHLTFRP